MNKQDENHLVMMKALLSFLELNKQIWQTSVPFAAAVTELKNDVNAIETLRQSTDLDQSGLVAEKNSLRTDVENLIFEVASQIYAMACKTKDQVLQLQVDFTKSELEKQRDGELATTCCNIIDIGRAKLTALLPYSITEVELGALEDLNDRYKNSLPSPRVSVAERKANNERMKGLFASSSLILKDQLNRMIVRFQTTEPDFYAGYFNAGKVVGYGTRYEKPVAPETPA